MLFLMEDLSLTTIDFMGFKLMVAYIIMTLDIQLAISLILQKRKYTAVHFVKMLFVMEY